MPLFHFTATVDTTVVKGREQFDYPSLEFAKVEARSVLSQFMSDRFPLGSWENGLRRNLRRRTAAADRVAALFSRNCEMTGGHFVKSAV